MREPLHDASVSGSGVRPEFGGPVHAEGRFSKVRRGLIGIRPRDASGVGARAALLLLLLQGGTHACGLLPASWGALFRGHRSLLSVSRRLLLHRRPWGRHNSIGTREARPAGGSRMLRSGPGRHGPAHPRASHGRMASTASASIFSNRKVDVHLATVRRPAHRLSSRPRPPGGFPRRPLFRSCPAVGRCR